MKKSLLFNVLIAFSMVIILSLILSSCSNINNEVFTKKDVGITTTTTKIVQKPIKIYVSEAQDLRKSKVSYITMNNVTRKVYYSNIVYITTQIMKQAIENAGYIVVNKKDESNFILLTQIKNAGISQKNNKINFMVHTREILMDTKNNKPVVYINLDVSHGVLVTYNIHGSAAKSFKYLFESVLTQMQSRHLYKTLYNFIRY